MERVLHQLMESLETLRHAEPSMALRRAFVAIAGALLVAAGAQLAVPIPGTAVPLTMQVPAVLIVGGLLGSRWGAVSLAVYLMMGVAGLPVFAPGGLPGVARLLGPTGGYLLAYPLAAAIAGLCADKPSLGRLAGALAGATLVIHAAGVSQLAILGGDANLAVRMGSVPFIAGDVAKLLLAGLVIRRLAPHTRALR